MLKYEANVATGKYTKDGQEKTRWMKVGAVIERSSGTMAMKLDVIPLPNEKGQVWIELFEPRQSDAPKSTKEDDVPW